MIDMLEKNGLAFLFVGIESGVQRVLDDFNKNTTPDKSVYMLKTISEHNVVPQIGFIFFDPYITLEEIKMNIRFLSEVKSYTFFSLLSIDKLIVLKGTEYASQNQSKINFKENGGEFTYSFTCELVVKYYRIFLYVFSNCKKIDMFLRSKLDSLGWYIFEFHLKNSLLMNSYKEVMFRLNSLTIKVLDSIMECTISGDVSKESIVKYYRDESLKLVAVFNFIDHYKTKAKETTT